MLTNKSIISLLSNRLILNLGAFKNLRNELATFRKMSNWESEKKQYLSMNIDDKRKVYKSAEYFVIDQIPTWKQYAEKHQPLPDKIPLLPKNQINCALNEKLVNKISIFTGDITTLEIDAIVNAANHTLKGGGGVDGAIHRAAGPRLAEECKTLGGCHDGEAKITGAYKLPSKYVIHTVGPRGEKPAVLAHCYKNSLNIIQMKDLRTIAFPCISTGIYGYPAEPAAHVAVMAVRKHLESNPNAVDRIIFCIFLPEDEQIYQGILQSYFPLK